MELNIGVLIAQWVNFLLILFLFKWLIWDKISVATAARRAELTKAENAAVAYDKAVADAETAKQELINEWLAHKAKLVQEAEAVAKNKEASIIDAANKKAAQIEEAATNQAQQMKASIESEFAGTVKSATEMVIKKLIPGDSQLKQDYLQSLVKEFAQTK